MRLLNEATGELIRGRCKATNQCTYCARQSARETIEMLQLDAVEYAPTVAVVLTARQFLERADTRLPLKYLLRDCRRRWPEIQWAVLCEVQARGALHLNLLVKGVPVADVSELEERMATRWCSMVDAERGGQHAKALRDHDGFMRYCASHFTKPQQALPVGWKGHRFSATRGYLVRPAAVMREEARQAIRVRASRRRAEQRGEEGDQVEDAIAADQLARAATTWRRIDVQARALREKGRTAEAGGRTDGRDAGVRPAAGRPPVGRHSPAGTLTDAVDKPGDERQRGAPPTECDFSLVPCDTG